MTMTRNLVLVRHGESEGNVASRRSKSGDDSAFTDEFKARHSSSWRLTDKGISQAQTAGLWIRENIGTPFGRYYTSEYLRAMETAYHLALPDAVWCVDFNLRERDWGYLDLISQEERLDKFAGDLRRREMDSFFWTPPNGESMAQLCLRINKVLDTLHRECSDMNVVIVCHGEVMWAFRVQLERMSQRRFKQLDNSSDPRNRIHNCQILHYTRKNPETGSSGPYLSWVRSVCPTDLTLSGNEWRKIERKSYSNEELLETVQETPRLLND